MDYKAHQNIDMSLPPPCFSAQSRYAPVAYLLDHCCHRTTAPTTVSVNNSSSADASVTSHSEEEQTATTSSPCDGVVHANDQGTSAITDTAASQDTAAPSAAKGDEDEKKTLRFEMHDGRDAKRLAELATAQVMRSTVYVDQGRI